MRSGPSSDRHRYSLLWTLAAGFLLESQAFALALRAYSQTLKKQAA